MPWSIDFLMYSCLICFLKSLNHLIQACGFIHAIRHQHLASLDSFMKAVDEPIHAFSFIHDMLQQLHGEESDAFRVKVMSRIPDLIMISR